MMITTLMQVLASVAVGQSEAASTPAWAVAVGILGALGIGAAVVLFGRNQAQAAALRAAEAKIAEVHDAKKKSEEKASKQIKNVDKHRDASEELKRDLAAQKKKGHEQQQENKKLKDELGELKEALERARNDRPAFVDVPAARPAESKDKGAHAPAKGAHPPASEAHATPSEPREAAAPASLAAQGSGVSSELKERHERLQKDYGELQAALAEVRAGGDGDKKELRRLKKKVEDYRRIDVMSQGKLQALEERVNQLGRQYYEACTEIAVLKGEVPRLPAPSERPPAPRAPAAKPGSATEPNVSESGAAAAPVEPAEAGPS